MFKFLEEDAQPGISFEFEGNTVEASQEMSVAEALLASGVTIFRHSCREGEPRGPFCLMGACYECVVLINGISTQACMAQASSGIDVRRVEQHTSEHDQ